MFEIRARLCAVVGMLAATLISAGWEPLAMISGILAVALVAAGIPIRLLGRNLLLIGWLALCTVAAYCVGEQPWQQGLLAGGLAAWRLLLLVGWATLLGHGASPLVLAHALEWLLSPLKAVHVPVASLSLVAMLTLRFLPILAHEQEMLHRTYLARGIDLGQAPLRRRLHGYVLLAVPLLTHLIRRAEHLSAAMDSRGFQASAVRTVLPQPPLRCADYALVAASMVFFGGIAALAFR